MSLKLETYFTKLTSEQKQQFDTLEELILEWNTHINLISRKDTEMIELHHVLHSLSIVKFTKFSAGSQILDLGTGGGFPGLPLAIMFPQSEFLLVDARAKKIMVVKDIIEKLGLKNCVAVHARVEELKSPKFDFVVSRAVAKLETLMLWCNHLISDQMKNALPNGLICLKGGNLDQEIQAVKKKHYVEKVEITNYLKESYFQDKYIVYVQK